MKGNNLAKKGYCKEKHKWHVKTTAASHNWVLLSEAKGGGIIGGKLQEKSPVQKPKQNVVTNVTSDL